MPTKKTNAEHAPDPTDTAATTYGVEAHARAVEKKTRAAIGQTPLVPVWIDPVIGREGELITYRLNGVAYHVKTKQVVMVPQALADVIYDQARRRKFSARSVMEYAAGFGKEMGELR